MSEQPLLNVSDDNLGKVEIAPEVIEVIAGLAASEVDGLYAMRGNFASGVVERFGKKSHSKGVKVELTDNGIVIDLYVILHFGVSIPNVAQMLQSNIRQTLKNMTALEIDEINVHVVGIQMDATEEGLENN
ncbi:MULTISPECIES: Asp23/Gls24 family envelope stress response protein [Clostridia]|uniref:Asp23/Gls24 family envelope stress response protein n=1 Tax=Clostridia TaxID=186801 RepID=UPI000EA4013E|nr:MULTISPECIES: Asp23/Gls24 family envelope stress response protein [Clostridia]NBJ70195.1 Asp23/Gls24 family envelope stress response protein [Roseburia sp. 1XD42-34]RKI76936.1 Asp23/Gls24 family envelope stress response protein [Clostridium sp. 1xD42-85]